MTAPLIVREDSIPVPPTWCVIHCEQGCGESWTVDVADFDPPLTAAQVGKMLTQDLLHHEHTAHGVAQRTMPAAIDLVGQVTCPACADNLFHVEQLPDETLVIRCADVDCANPLTVRLVEWATA